MALVVDRVSAVQGEGHRTPQPIFGWQKRLVIVFDKTGRSALPQMMLLLLNASSQASWQAASQPNERERAGAGKKDKIRMRHLTNQTSIHPSVHPAINKDEVSEQSSVSGFWARGRDY